MADQDITSISENTVSAKTSPVLPADGKVVADPVAPVSNPADLVSEIGTLTYPKAAVRFGKSRAIEIMQQVALLGGHGVFDEAELKSPLFGGLAMPPNADSGKPKRADFDSFADADFFYKSAVEDYEAAQTSATTARNKINEYYAGLK